MLIFSPSLDEAGVNDELKRLDSILSEREARVVRTDNWGKRRFAYELKHEVEGYYAILDVEGESSAMDELARVANLSDKILRYKIVHLPQSARSAT